LELCFLPPTLSIQLWLSIVITWYRLKLYEKYNCFHISSSHNPYFVQVPFYESLNIDVSGSNIYTEKEKTVISIEKKEAYRYHQLLIQLCVLGCVIKELFPKLGCEMVGKLYLPKSKDFDMDIWKKGINLFN
jgi:hypothetical protein